MTEWILGIILILSALGVILVRLPVHACLCFLVTLLTLAAFYLELSASFIAVMQVIVYAGAILVLFMFVVILFQDAYLQIAETKPKSNRALLIISCAFLLSAFTLLLKQLITLPSPTDILPKDFGTVQALGRAIYLDFFFPFEAVILIFLVAIVGALYIGKKAI